MSGNRPATANSIRTNVTCPYCGFVNQWYLEMSAYEKRNVVLCDCDEGGCDQHFVLAHRCIVKLKTVRMEVQL